MAIILHLTVLGLLISLPSRSLVEDDADANPIVTLVLEPTSPGLAHEPDGPAETSPRESELPPLPTAPQQEAPPSSPELAFVPIPEVPPPTPPPPTRPIAPVLAPIQPRRAVSSPIRQRSKSLIPAEQLPAEVAMAKPKSDVLGPYRSVLLAHLQPYKRYPALARV